MRSSQAPTEPNDSHPTQTTHAHIRGHGHATELHLDDGHAHSHSHAASSNSVMVAPVASSATPASLRWSSSEMELSNHHRVMSAAIGAFLTSLVVTPFDVVKTRLQAQINSIATAPPTPVAPSAAASCAVPRRPPTASQLLLADCSHYRLHTGLMDSWCNNCFSQVGVITVPESAKHPELRFTGALDAAVKLVKHEGLTSLWRGLSPTILMSIPSTVVYFSLYDKSKIALAKITPERVEHHLGKGAGEYTQALQTFSPLLAGVTARAVTTTLVSPIELVRTKSQSLRTSASMISLLKAEWHSGGILSLWRGVGPTLMRDVPFSAIYWSSYEYSKSFLLNHWSSQQDTPSQSKKHWIYASFLSGAGSGMLSAAITHPFDLIKTRRQIELYKLQEAKAAITPAAAVTDHVHSATCSHGSPSSTAATTARASPAAPSSLPTSFPSTTGAVFKTIVAEEGYVGLLSGLSARITKIAPACAIMISVFEASKMYFGEQNQPASQQRHNNLKHRFQEA